jgi:hypothetical protein
VPTGRWHRHSESWENETACRFELTMHGWQTHDINLAACKWNCTFRLLSSSNLQLSSAPLRTPVRLMLFMSKQFVRVFSVKGTISCPRINIIYLSLL